MINLTNNDRTEGSSKAYSCRYFCRFVRLVRTLTLAVPNAQTHTHSLPPMLCFSHFFRPFSCSDQDKVDKAAAAKAAAAVAAPAAPTTAKALEQQAKSEEQAARELEDENYKQMQNFDDYSKSVKKTKLTLAGLMGKGGEAEEAAAEGGAEESEQAADAEEEYYEEGAEGEYYEGEEGEYCEEEAAPVELDGMAAMRPRKERAMEKLNDWYAFRLVSQQGFNTGMIMTYTATTTLTLCTNCSGGRDLLVLQWKMLATLVNARQMSLTRMLLKERLSLLLNFSPLLAQPLADRRVEEETREGWLGGPTSHRRTSMMGEL